MNAYNPGTYSNPFIARGGLAAYDGFNYTDAATTLRARQLSIYANNQMKQEETLENRFPTFSLYDELVTRVGDEKTQSYHGFTALGVPALQELSQGLNTVYRTGSGTDGDLNVVPTYQSMAESYIQTKEGNAFSTPTDTHPYFQVITKPAFTQFMLPGALQTPTWGEFYLTRGRQVGCNLFIAGDDNQFMDNAMEVLNKFAKNGMYAMNFHKNFLTYTAAMTAGVNTVTAGNYGNGEVLGPNNQTNGTTDGYQPISLFTPASITGAFSGLYKMTAQTDGIQRNATGAAMTGTRRIQGNNVPTRVFGAGTGPAGTGVLTWSELRAMADFRNKRNRSGDKYKLFVDPIEGSRQLRNIPEFRNFDLNKKALDINAVNDRTFGGITPEGIEIMCDPAIIPMGASNLRVAILAPVSGSKGPFRSIVNEEPNTREIQLPYEDPRRKNICLRQSMQVSVHVVEPGEVALCPYGSAA